MKTVTDITIDKAYNIELDKDLIRLSVRVDDTIYCITVPSSSAANKVANALRDLANKMEE